MVKVQTGLQERVRTGQPFSKRVWGVVLWATGSCSLDCSYAFILRCQCPLDAAVYNQIGRGCVKHRDLITFTYLRPERNLAKTAAPPEQTDTSPPPSAPERTTAAAMEGILLGFGLMLGSYVLIYFNFLKGSKCRSARSLRGKTVIITGGNTGIGKTTALDLAQRGARVILACRSKERGESAVYDIRKESGNQQVLFMKLDLASLTSVRAFAETFLKSEPRLDILINNAGVGADGISENGANLIFRVNHLGHFLLTNLLLQRLKQCAPSRIVIVASNAYRNGRIDFAALNLHAKGWRQNLQSYCNSKLANILFARELATRLDGTQVTCYAVHPGVVYTDLFRSMNWLMKMLFTPFAWLFFKDCVDGAQTSIHCAVQEGIEPFSGRYFRNCGVAEVRSHGRDDAIAKKLWEVSETLVGVAVQS